MSAKQVLVVEDDKAIREMIAFGLKRSGFEVSEADSCCAARALMMDRRLDLALVDWVLPDMSGLAFMRTLKRSRETRNLPIILVTARAEPANRVAGLESGADDYVTRPFSLRELVARINLVLRRNGEVGAGKRSGFDGLSVDHAAHRVFAGEQTVEMGPTEYRLIDFFMTHPDHVFSRDQLLARLWSVDADVLERTIDVHIRRLRKALAHTGHDRFVQTVRGTGYRFSARTA